MTSQRVAPLMVGLIVSPGSKRSSVKIPATTSNGVWILLQNVTGTKVVSAKAKIPNPTAPIHHHFEASGWPETKVTMRFWVVGQVAAVVGLTLAALGGHI